MTREEKLEALRTWFDGRVYPPGRLEVSPGEYVVDPEKFVARQLAGIYDLKQGTNSTQTAILERYFRTYYMRLYHFRELIKSKYRHE